MSSYSTVVVGTDGSDTSLAAVDRAAALAADAGARLLIACAYVPASERETAHDRDVLRDEAFLIVGSAPAEDNLRTARDRAAAAGAKDVDTRAMQGKAADSLCKIVQEAGADLLVVGNRGLRGLAGRILGSVPLDVARQAGVDVLIVHTT
jgi:nucleotide-binding universal stress UspA family protein